MADSLIQTQGLTRRFGKLTAVDGIALNVPEGCVYGFLGPNGAGKTTTIRMLLGLLRADDGDILLFGQPFQQRKQRLRQIGALVESPSLYAHLTGRENLELTRKLLGVDRNRVQAVLAMVDLKAAASRKVAHYSTGMRQRLGLALALMHSPRLLILDEPTNGLDPAGIREFRHLIREFPKEQGITVFLSSHLLGEVEQTATHIGIIDQGRLLFQGRMEELKCSLQTQAEIEVDDPDRAASLLGNSALKISGRRLTFPVGSRNEIAAVNSRLVKAGIGVFALRHLEPDLENIFLSLTNVEKEGSK